MASLSFEEEFDTLVQEDVKSSNEFLIKLYALFDKDPAKFVEYGIKILMNNVFDYSNQLIEHFIKITPEQEQEIRKICMKINEEFKNDENIKHKMSELNMMLMEFYKKVQPINEVIKEQKQEETNIVPNGHDLKKLVLFSVIKDIDNTTYESTTLNTMIHDSIRKFMELFEWNWDIFEKDLNKHENYYYKCLINMITVEELQKFIECLNNKVDNLY